MAKFNGKKLTPAKKVITNVAGGDSYKESAELELVSTVITSLLDNKFYEGSNETMERVRGLIDQLDPKFTAKTAIYARNELGIRSITHAIAAELSARVKGENWTKNFYNNVIYRVDDITETLAYYMGVYGKKIPNSLKKGLAKAFSKFDAYQLAKYRSERSDVSLIDAVNLLHPTPTKKNSDALKKLIAGSLKSKDTWEVKLTQAGQKAETEEQKKDLKEDAWKDLIESKKIGYFALLRNLRNIAQQAPKVIDAACELLTDKELIKKSLVMPFRFHTAFEAISSSDIDSSIERKINKALAKAIDISLDNVPSFDGKTLIVLDGSGSMDGKPWDTGSLFAAALFKKNENADLMLFSDDAAYTRGLNSDDSIMTIKEQINSKRINGGTNFHAIFEKANKKYDRIVILSDMQGWMENSWGHSGAPTHQFKTYKAQFKADPFVYSFNLNDYGTLMFPENKVYALAGLSDKIFDIMKLLEEDRNALINRIKAVEL